MNSFILSVADHEHAENFKEATELKISLENIEVQAFNDIIQYMGTGSIIELNDVDDFRLADEEKSELEKIQRPPTCKSICEKFKKSKLRRLRTSQYLEFLIAADFLMILPNPFLYVRERLMDIYHYIDDGPLNHEIVVRVFQLPSGHPARELVTEICADNYLGSRFALMPCRFEYQEELNSVPGFASQLLGTVVAAMTNTNSPCRAPEFGAYAPKWASYRNQIFTFGGSNGASPEKGDNGKYGLNHNHQRTER